MKTLEKKTISQLRKAKFTRNDEGLAFLKDVEMFTEKNARAKEKLKNIQWPPR